MAEHLGPTAGERRPPAAARPSAGMRRGNRGVPPDMDPSHGLGEEGSIDQALLEPCRSIEIGMAGMQSSEEVGTDSESDSGESGMQRTGMAGSGEGRRERRILANRRSAQRSRTRRMQYIHEVERKGLMAQVEELRAKSEAMSAALLQLRRHHSDLSHRKADLQGRVASLMASSQQREAACWELRCEVSRLRSQVTGTPVGGATDQEQGDRPGAEGRGQGMLQVPLGESTPPGATVARDPALLPGAPAPGPVHGSANSSATGHDPLRGPTLSIMDSRRDAYMDALTAQAAALQSHNVDLANSLLQSEQRSQQSQLWHGQGQQMHGHIHQPFRDIEDSYFLDRPLGDDGVIDLLGEVLGQEPAGLCDLWPTWPDPGARGLGHQYFVAEVADGLAADVELMGSVGAQQGQGAIGV